MASGIEVHCHFTRIAPAASLSPHPKNAHRKHPAKQLDRFELVIKGRGTKLGNGWRRAIVVSKRSGHIVRGHGAYLMALRRGWDVPIEEQSYATEREEIRDLLADNKLAELAETDNAALAQILSEIRQRVLWFANHFAGLTEMVNNERWNDEAKTAELRRDMTAARNSMGTHRHPRRTLRRN